MLRPIYRLSFPSPQNHFAKVVIELERPKDRDQLVFFLPCWSPGSYLMREYGKNVRCVKALAENGEALYFEQVGKSQWKVDFKTSELAQECQKLTFEYEVYCHELTVRTSHIDTSHAFIHGPSVFMGILDTEIEKPLLAVDVPASWSKISTGLTDVSEKRDEFLYTAANYDELIDAPLEIGCHETDGFYSSNKAHELAFYGRLLPSKSDQANMKEDIKKIVEHVSETMGGMPYEHKYTFISHFVPGKFGGLEHLNSTALQFCPLKLNERKGYLKWLELVAHEYFHTWNVKRIRPRELGPFDYLNEAMTRMHWLTEGLTSFMDQLFVYRAGFSTLEEYCELMKDNINAYLKIPGRRFHSLEDSSFNTWIKLYRPDENSHNSSISYYLKGGIVFFVLNARLAEQSKSIDDLLALLWQRYLDDPKNGVDSEEVLAMIESVAGPQVREEFEVMIKTTEEIDLEKICGDIGMKFIYEESEKSGSWLGVKSRNQGGRVFIDSVVLDGPAFKSGLNAGDEVIAINGLRVDAAKFSELDKFLFEGKTYTFTVSRLEHLVDIEVQLGRAPKLLKQIDVSDRKKLESALKR